MEVFYFNSDILGTNNYLCYDKESGEALLIDCSCDIEQVEKKIAFLGANLKYILLTHGHFDHVATTLQAKSTFPEAKILISKRDQLFLDNIDKQTEIFGIDAFEVAKMDAYFSEDTSLYLGKTKIEIIETPGHSAGSVTFKINDILFTGDTLFREEIGRCDLPTGDFITIKKSIINKLFALNGDFKVFPGHGAPSTLSYERAHNAYFGSASGAF